MKRLFLTLMVLFIGSGAIGQVSQWDVYNSIPNYKSMKLNITDENVILGWKNNSGESGLYKRTNERNYSIEMKINGDYSVDFFYSNPYETQAYGGLYASFTIVGKGQLLWLNEHMVLQMEVKKEASAGYRDLPNGNVFFCEEINNTSTLIYDVEYRESSGYSTFVFKKGEDIITTRNSYMFYAIRGNNEYLGSSIDRIILTGEHFVYDAEHKSQSELNAQTSDMYGKWQWNDDRSVIYLESTSKDAFLVLWNNNGNLSWGFQLDSAASGYKTETAESGAELAYLMLTFDGGAEQSFTFEKTASSSTRAEFQYVQYDRFLGNLKHDASILGQIKDKRIMILNYKQNGSSKTAMFQLEGLEAIYNAITQ